MSEPPSTARGPRSRLARRASLAVERKSVFGFLVVTTAATAVVAGLVVHVIDKKDFPTFGIGVWWSIVTLATVGYGDVVPHTAWGRVVGGVVIVLGVTFISFLIAIVTSLFVDANREALEEARASREQETRALLESIDGRLAAIESRLGAAPDADRP